MNSSQAFQVHALDYLLKSYSDEQFEGAFSRAKEHIREKQTSRITDRLFALIESHKKRLDIENSVSEPDYPRSAGENYLTRLVIKESGRVYFIKVDEIDWIESAYVHMITRFSINSPKL